MRTNPKILHNRKQIWDSRALLGKGSFSDILPGHDKLRIRVFLITSDLEPETFFIS
jgi:hypothetical protein